MLFVSSSGHCTLNCPYCIIKPVAKNEPSLTPDDFRFLFNKFKGKKIIGLSGKGDFFAGYHPEEKLLWMILQENVEVILDINGVFIHDFSQIPDRLIEKISAINLTMHYQQLKQKGLLDVWCDNAMEIIRRRRDQLFLGSIISPLVAKYWDEALNFYEQNIFKRTSFKVTLVRDEINPMHSENEDMLGNLEQKYAHIIQSVCQTDFSEPFKAVNNVLCPAGVNYFRIWNDGTVNGCPIMPELSNAGNIKAQKIILRNSYFECNNPHHCDCAHIHSRNKMIIL
jgi:hypothetical protein